MDFKAAEKRVFFCRKGVFFNVISTKKTFKGFKVMKI